MAKRTVSRKKLLKEPDKFTRWMNWLSDFAKAKRNSLIILGAIVFLVAAGIVGLRYMSARSESNAFALLDQTESVYAQTAAKGSVATALATVSDNFKQLLNRYGNTLAGRLARLREADAQFAAGHTDTAITLYDGALREFAADPMFREQINDDLGHAYLRKKDYDKALNYFQQVANGPKLGRSDEALFIMAWIYRKKGESSKARKLYAQIVTEYPNSMYIDMAKARANG